jgi:hypothetical protein
VHQKSANTQLLALFDRLYIKSYPIIDLDRPLGLQEVETPRISRQSVHEGGKVVSRTHWVPLPPGDIPGTHFSQRLSRP